MNADIKIINKRIYKGEDIGDIKVKSYKYFKPINCPENLKSQQLKSKLINIFRYG